MTSRRTPFLALAPLAAALFAACSAPPPELGEPRLPAPTPGRGETAHVLEEGAEEGNRELREAWIEAMHRAAPGVDWRAIERANGRREMERRRRLVREERESGGDLFALASAPAWSEVGSRNQAGRMHCAVVGPDGKLYAGSSRGGLWRGNPDGTDWEPLGDNLYGGVHEVLVVPGRVPGGPPAILVATDGGSVHVSHDEGLSWSAPAGLPSLQSVRGVARLQDASDSLLVLGRYDPGGGSRAGLFKSTDRGHSFQNVWTGDASWDGGLFVPRVGAGAATDVWVQHRDRVERSTDGGQTWQALGTIAGGSFERGLLTGCEAGAPILYAGLRQGGSWSLYRSLDAGLTWAYRSPLEYCWEELRASSTNPGLIVQGAVEAWRSTDGGGTWSRVNTWGSYYGDPANRLHADMMGLYAWPDESLAGVETWYFCTDGGVYESPAGGLPVHNLSLSGLGVSQYYSTHTSRAHPERIVAGSQDQGYQRGILQPPLAKGPSTDFDQLISGDYGHLTSGDGTHGLVYSTYPGFILVQDGAVNPTLRFVDFPPGSSQLWLPPVVADPLEATSFFFLAEQLYRYVRTGPNAWVPSVHNAGDLTPGPASYLTGLAFAPSDPQRAFAVNDRGQLFASTDHGVTWTQSVYNGPGEHYFYGSGVAVHPTRPQEAVVCGSGYSTAGVRRTTDGGATWVPLGQGLPVTHFYDVAYAEDGSGDVFAGAETGAWVWRAATDQWENLLEPGTPITTYWSVEVVDGGATARFGTYGRGIWDHDVAQGNLGTWTPYGAGVGGANHMQLACATPPTLGSTCTLQVSTVPIASPAWLLRGSGQGSTPFAGGTLLVDPVLSFRVLEIGAGGQGSVDVRIQDAPNLIGSEAYFQVYAPDPSQPGGYALSNGLRMIVGP